jgi:hypothetical protein
VHDITITPFNPLDKKNLGASVAEAMLEQPAIPLKFLPPFNGVGIYALYYCGQFEPYTTISKINRGNEFAAPIYIGKAVPKGARKGGGVGDSTNSKALFNRLREHAESIEAATNLNIDDFFCRFLVVDDIWIPLGESLLIAKFSPVWNVVLDGFGNHNPGRGRVAGLRSKWDVLHPGRIWANNFVHRTETADHLATEIKNYLASRSFPASPHILVPYLQPKV